MHSLITDDPSVHDLLTQLDKDPTYRWSDDQTSDLGCDRSTIRRVFKRTFGTTFLDLARAHNLQAGFTTLAGGRQGIVAQLEAGFESAAALPLAYAKMVGIKLSAFSKTALLQADWFHTYLVRLQKANGG
jgi:AraC family transcriptional regulator of adaptative response/methylated-DNA-[protein]-cysteine methyltransferase